MKIKGYLICKKCGELKSDYDNYNDICVDCQCGEALSVVFIFCVIITYIIILS